MIGQKRSLRKITMATGVVAMAVGLVTAFSFEANAQATTGGGYCKNDPSRNTGICFKSTQGVFSCLEAQGGTTNKDCYDVQN